MKILMGLFVSLIIISMVLLYTPIFLPQQGSSAPPGQNSSGSSPMVETHTETQTQVNPPSMELETGAEDTDE